MAGTCWNSWEAAGSDQGLGPLPVTVGAGWEDTCTLTCTLILCLCFLSVLGEQCFLWTPCKNCVPGLVTRQ